MNHRIIVMNDDGTVAKCVDRDELPICGVDFCDSCGDCLSCHGDEPCWDGGVNNGPHMWVTYVDAVAVQP